MHTDTLDIVEATAHDKDYFFALTTVRLTTDRGNEKMLFLYKRDVLGFYFS